MASNQENSCVGGARLAKKRAMEAIGSQFQPANKKRVVLGDLSNNVVVVQKTTPKKVIKKDVKSVKIPLNEDKSNDPQLCEAYVEDIYDYLRNMEMEVKRRPLADYIEKVQKDVPVNMRGVLIDWLVEGSEEYNLLPESLRKEKEEKALYFGFAELQKKKKATGTKNRSATASNYNLVQSMSLASEDTQFAVGVLKLLLGGISLVRIWIVLSIKDKLNYLEQPIPPAPVALESQLVAHEITTAHTAWIKGSKEIAGLMLMTMEQGIQQNLENLHAHEMLQELKTM
ncbi:G2/mitotic-specific cyclin C13-1-like protein, partial [Tanacetum coccineum]